MTALLLSTLLAISAADGDGVRILVVDLKTTADVSADVASVVGGIVTSRISRFPRAEVLSGADIRDMIALEAEKQTAGCDDTGCLAEVAGALGAEFIVTGQIGRLGDRFVISLSLIDTVAGKAIARETREIDDLGQAPEVVRPMVDELMASMKSRVGVPEDTVTFLDLVSGSLTWTGYGLFFTGLGTLLVQSVVFGIAGGSLPGGSLETAWIPVCGPFGTFLVAGNRDVNSQLTDLSFACCVCESASCAAILCGSPLVATGLAVDLIPDEAEEDAAAALLLPDIPADPLLPEDRARLADAMPF